MGTAGTFAAATLTVLAVVYQLPILLVAALIVLVVSHLIEADSKEKQATWK